MALQFKTSKMGLYTIKRNPSKSMAICVAEIEEIYNETLAREVIEDLWLAERLA
jgi:hypothetical protein